MAKKILILFLLIGITSCCKEDDVTDCISISWNVGVYHNAIKKSKHLTIEIYPQQGRIDATDFSTIWVFSNTKESTTIRIPDTDFDYESFKTNGIRGVTWSPLNYILDDYSWVLKEVSITGRIKISGAWYKIDNRRTF